MLNSKFTTLLLVIICILQTLVFFYLLKKPQTISDSNSIENINDLKLEQTPPGQTKDLADISEFDEIIQRPLFSNSRKPEEEKVEKIIKSEIKIKPVRKPEFMLTGIVLTNEEELALIKSRRNSQINRLRLDEVIEGWKLIEIDPEMVILSSGDQKITLEIERKATPGLIQKENGTINQTKSEEESILPSDKTDPVSEIQEKKQDEFSKEEF